MNQSYSIQRFFLLRYHRILAVTLATTVTAQKQPKYTELTKENRSASQPTNSYASPPVGSAADDISVVEIVNSVTKTGDLN